jgi:hypothetical protein
MAKNETPLKCYNCGRLIQVFDFYWVIQDNDGNQFLAEDLGYPEEIEDCYKYIEIKVCPFCCAHY